MRSAPGAIEKVVLDGDLRASVIGGGLPRGICGSGLIDLVAELLRLGIVSPDGRLVLPEGLPAPVPAAIGRRVRRDGDGRTGFVVAGPDRTGDGRPILLTQGDIRELQLGCGAIRAGIVLLLRQAGLTTDDLATVLIAGGFGSFIRRDKAQAVGLLPNGIDHQRIHYVGNVSLAGARRALVSLGDRQRGEALARRAHHVELSLDPDFQEVYVEAMYFPLPADPAHTVNRPSTQGPAEKG
jgi:uncharacterized 2Fe-2S/4Fe-4S cluster protein (DUF4445 family)